MRVRSCLITGASTGIGEACALRLDAAGWRVFAGVRRDEDAARLRAKLSDRSQPLIVDVVDQESIARAAEIIGAALREDGLDGLVNNAGIAVTGPLEFLPLAEFRQQFDVNVTGQIAVTQALLPALRAARGRVVFMSSVSGRASSPLLTPYTASKFAIEAIADGLRLELRRWGIRVVLVEPGSVDTDIWRGAEAQFDAGVAAMTDEHRQLYGGLLAGSRKMVRATAKRAAPVDKVVAAIVDAVTAERPRTRYVVGADARAQILLNAALPDRAYDALAARMTGA